jgi:Mor family transcriptional regulator
MSISKRGFTMDEVLEAIGPEAATLLTDNFGGCVFSVPEKCEGAAVFQQIVKVIGQQAADILIKLAAGELICIPARFAAKLHKRNEAIFNERKAGTHIRELALKYRMSQRNIQSCIVKHRKLIEQR